MEDGQVPFARDPGAPKPENPAGRFRQAVPQSVTFSPGEALYSLEWLNERDQSEWYGR
jgi:hypothetical protein